MILNFILLTVILGYFIISIQKKYSYWQKKGVNGPYPIPVIGNFGKILFFRESIDVFTKRIYEEYPNEKVVGLYKGFTPVLLLKDPDIMKNVLTKDFKFFSNRGMKTSESGLNNNLFSLEGESWRVLRKKLTPLFTLKKLKSMTPLIQSCVTNFINHIDMTLDLTDTSEIKSLLGKYTIDVVTSCFFGFDLNVYNSNEGKKFENVGAEIFSPSLLTRLWYQIEMIIPGIHKRYPSIDPAYKVRNFFLSLVRNAIIQREGKVLERIHFMDLMIGLKEMDETADNSCNTTHLEITEEVIAAEAYAFYGAGSHSSSLTMAFLMYELAFHQNIQDQLHNEICSVIKRFNGELSIESLQEMTYLQMVLCETLRKYTTIGWLIRKASEDYEFLELNLKIQNGTSILISTAGIHRDSKYYPNPEKFNPENFSRENKKTIPQYTFLPFGSGPRNCIGARFAEIQMTMAIAAFFMEFKVEPCEKTEKELRYDPKCITLNTLSGIWLKTSRRK